METISFILFFFFFNAAISVLRWSENLPQFQIFIFCCRDNNATLNPQQTHSCWPHSTHHEGTSLYTWNKALRQPTGCQKGTAYHLKYHAIHVTLGLYDLYSLKFTKLTVQKQSRRPVILWFWTVSIIRWASRYAITKSLCMHKSAGRAQAPGFGKKQAYTVKVHAK